MHDPRDRDTCHAIVMSEDSCLRDRNILHAIVTRSVKILHDRERRARDHDEQNNIHQIIASIIH
ncbi:hypothetical protein KY290_020234 [Solanum tuberosum]|uniref:Uncharacterized protein n=1 Tax=Solanum tuberosum TaxID=4113 RepID=A0ABQ7V053_SOLTU|nr:hypothetical protein KY290_020234 [Solanum tuberosum]